MKKVSFIALGILMAGIVLAHGMMGQGAGPMMGSQALGAQILVMPKQPLDQDEEQVLMKIFEQEKLARDLYKELYDRWKVRVFLNLAISKQYHFDMVKTLLEKYDVEYPADDTPGTFTDQELQKLHSEWLEKGKESLENALEVGAEAEEMNIYHVKEYLSQIDNDDLRIMLVNLSYASARHLKILNGFMTHYYDRAYRFQYLSREDVKEFYGQNFLKRAKQFLRKHWNRFSDEH